MKRIVFILAQLCLLITVSASIVRAQNHTQTVSVTNSPANITADGNYNQILLRENSATPTAVFSITLAGSSTALNYPAGTQFLFSGNFTNGQVIGTIVATAAGPFSFIAVESTGPPSMSVKNTIIGGGSGNATSIQGLSVSATPPSGVQCFESNSGDTQALWVNCPAGVSSFSAGNLSPLFISNVATATTTPALTFTLSNAVANVVFGNCTGLGAAPSYCSITGAMLPNPGASSLGGTESYAPVSHQWINAISTSGVPSSMQPAISDLVATFSSPLSLSTNTLSCPTCVTSAASLTSNAVVIGGGSQAISTISVDTTTTHVLFATAGAPAFRAIVAGDIPTLNQNTTGTAATITGTITLANTVLTTNGDLLSVSGAALARVAAAGGQDFVLQGASAAVPVWLAVNSCSSASNALTYSTTSHAFGCNTISGSGTVNSGTTPRLAYYASSTTAVSDTGANLTWSSPTLTIGVAGTTTGNLTLASATATGSITSAPASAASAFTVTIPAATDTLVNLAGTQTLTGKSIAASEINSGTLAIAQGGTNAASASAALINLFPAASEVGDIVYCSAYSSGCTAWTIIAGNTSGTKVLQETSSGVPSWVSSGASGVSSLTGDGTIITNSVSTGAVTLTIAGTSGGIPYFSSTSGWASSALLTHYGVLYGGGAAGAPVSTAAGTAGVPLKGSGSSAAPSFQSDNTCASTSTSDQITAAGAFATTCSVPATNLAVGAVIEVYIHGVWTTTATSSPKLNFEVNAGGTTGECPAASTAVALTASQTNGVFDGYCRIVIVTTGSSGTAIAGGNVQVENGAGAGGIPPEGFINASTVVYNTTISETVSVQETTAMVSGQTMNLQSLIVRVTP